MIFKVKSQGRHTNTLKSQYCANNCSYRGDIDIHSDQAMGIKCDLELQGERSRSYDCILTMISWGVYFYMYIHISSHVEQTSF